jgi:tetratricopeptide (TPR) repeat protein
VIPPLPPLAGFRVDGDALYEQARNLIERGRYELALDQFNRLMEMKTPRTDAAMYWKAYAAEKLGDQAQALATLADLQRQFANSRWLKDARALELEVRQASGQRVSPDAQPDEDLKLLALQGLMQNQPDQALPVIEKMLAGSDNVRVKDRALFLLSRSRNPQARNIIVSTAKSSSNPDLQLRAITYLGMMRDANGAAPEAASALQDVYKTTSDESVKRAVIRAMGMNNNAAALVALARAEKNPELKKEIVSRLSGMKGKEATDYLLELLK